MSKERQSYGLKMKMKGVGEEEGFVCVSAVWHVLLTAALLLLLEHKVI